jgi:predicted ABC-type ATPase
MPTMHVVAGPPGSGKTSAFPGQSFDCDYFNPDDYAAQLNGGSYVGIPMSIRKEVGPVYEKFIYDHIAEGKDFAIESSLRLPIIFDQMKQAHDAGFVVELNYVSTNSISTSIDRVAQRADLGGHSASEKAIRSIRGESLGNFPRAMDELGGGIDILAVYDNSAERAKPELVASFEGREVTYLAPEIPAWVDRALERTPYQAANLREHLEQGTSLPEVETVNGFRFWSKATNEHTMKFAAGKLVSPGAAGPRDLAAQRAVSRGTGDDAGHLIGHQFGGPETPSNLSLQHHAQNQGGGTYYNLEQRWAEKLLAGVPVEVEIREMTRAGEVRPYHRHVEWTEGVGESLQYGELDFMNPESARGRAAKGIVSPTYSTTEIIDLTPVLEARRAREVAEAKVLQVSNLVATNRIGTELGAEGIQQDMNTARERLLAGVDAATVGKEIGNERGGSSEARLYGKDLAASVQRQLAPELVKVLGREIER